jgi:hypothetical protein
MYRDSTYMSPTYEDATLLALPPAGEADDDEAEEAAPPDADDAAGIPNDPRTDAPPPAVPLGESLPERGPPAPTPRPRRAVMWVVARNCRNCDSLVTRKMPLPCALPTGFAIHGLEGLRLKASASMP